MKLSKKLMILNVCSLLALPLIADKAEADSISSPIKVQPALQSRFIDNGNGTVTDKWTGLIWLKKANCWHVNWQTALDNAKNLASDECDLDDGSKAGDWRLPNIRELHSLVDFSQDNPSLWSEHPFLKVLNSYYWSATTRVSFTSYAWVVGFNYGYVSSNVKTYTYYVWPVRGGQ